MPPTRVTALGDPDPRQAALYRGLVSLDLKPRMEVWRLLDAYQCGDVAEIEAAACAIAILMRAPSVVVAERIDVAGDFNL